MKQRILYGLSVLLTILVGLGSRKYGAWLPGVVAEYAGDILWAIMVYLGIRFLFFKLPMAKATLYALLFSYSIEFSQLYQADWINYIRLHTWGGLVLGQGFLWSDLVCYTIGIITVFCIDRMVSRIS